MGDSSVDRFCALCAFRVIHRCQVHFWLQYAFLLTTSSFGSFIGTQFVPSFPVSSVFRGAAQSDFRNEFADHRQFQRYVRFPNNSDVHLRNHFPLQEEVGKETQNHRGNEEKEN